MLLNLLNAQSASEGPSRFVGGGEAMLYALIGFSVVFLGIAFLIFIVWGAGKFLSPNKQEKAAPKETVKKETKPANQIIASNTANSEEIDEETIAIITAAIMAFYEKNNPKCEFTLKRIKRIGNCKSR